jgi:hypothetical protein
MLERRMEKRDAKLLALLSLYLHDNSPSGGW